MDRISEKLPYAESIALEPLRILREILNSAERIKENIEAEEKKARDAAAAAAAREIQRAADAAREAAIREAQRIAEAAAREA